MTWTDWQRIWDLIKNVVFDQQLVNPKDCVKEWIIALKKLVSQFSAVDDNLFFTAFRCSASEYLLAKDLDTIKLHHTIHQGLQAAPLQTNQASSASAPLQIVSLHRKQANKQITMPSSPIHACLSRVVSSWVDKNTTTESMLLLPCHQEHISWGKKRSSAMIPGLVLVLFGNGHISCLILSKFLHIPASTGQFRQVILRS